MSNRSQKVKDFLVEQCISGCRYLQTHCVTCGLLVIERHLPRRLSWIFMKDEEPKEDQEILFISESTENRIGTVWMEEKRVTLQNPDILQTSDIGFDEIDCWMPIPKDPR